MKDLLFDEFDSVTAKQWKQKIQFDLKGAEYRTLLTHTNEGIDIKPFYHLENTIPLNIPLQQHDFSICQSIFISDEKTANFLAKDALKRGATSILFETNESFDINKLLKNVIASKEKQSVEFYFKLNFLSQTFIEELLYKTQSLTIHLNIDIIGNLAKTGNWFYNKEEDYTILTNILQNTSIRGSVISVDASLYQNAGANTVQQVAYALAHANDYLNYFNNAISRNEMTRQSFHKIQFNFSIGSNYFFEIAKLRAFRLLWQTLIDEYNLSIQPKLFITPSLRNKTLYDYNVNMLRTITECMSAVLGGADTISNNAYDTIFHKKNEFGERIARNQLLILQEESYFKEASQFAEGSYYIEALTQEIAEKALVIFKNIEKSGGFLEQLFNGTIQRKIGESAQKEQQQFDNKEVVLIGTNKYIETTNQMKEEIELYPFVKYKPRKTVIKPIVPRRLAEELEKERLMNESY